MSSDSPAAYGDPATRGRILEVAWAMLGERGELTIGDVAREAGVSRQAVYLHFGDRAGLVLGLVHHMDESLGLGESLAEVFAAASGVEAMERAVLLHGTFNPGIDSVARVLEAARGADDPLARAWRDRMTFRLEVHRQIVRRIADDGLLAESWTVERAAELFHSVTLPAVWRELTQQLGWSAEDYVGHLTDLLRSALLRR